MSAWFLLSLAGFTASLLPYFLSLEHGRLRRLLGEGTGRLVGDILGVASGWGFFGFWIGIWVAPQTRLSPIGFKVALLGYASGLLNLALALVFLLPGFWYGLKGVRELGLRVSETHRPVEVVSSGVYGVVRHPQYLGGLLGHLGVSMLLSSRDSLLVTPLVLAAVYAICWKEEHELLKEFGEAYQQYTATVPMLIPRLRSRNQPT